MRNHTPTPFYPNYMPMVRCVICQRRAPRKGCRNAYPGSICPDCQGSEQTMAYLRLRKEGP